MLNSGSKLQTSMTLTSSSSASGNVSSSRIDGSKTELVFSNSMQNARNSPVRSTGSISTETSVGFASPIPSNTTNTNSSAKFSSGRVLMNSVNALEGPLLSTSTSNETGFS